MKFVLRVTGNHRGLYSPGAYFELYAQLERNGGIPTNHRADLIEVHDFVGVIEINDLIDDGTSELDLCDKCGGAA